MANAGASIEAFLRLDATSFQTGIAESTSALNEFKKAVLSSGKELSNESKSLISLFEKVQTSLADIGAESSAVSTGYRQLDSALVTLVATMSNFDDVSTSSVNKFKTMASGIENMATAAQRMSVVMERGGTGIEALNTIMQVFETGMANAEVQLKLTNAQIQQLTNQSTHLSSSTNSVSNSLNNLRNSSSSVLSEFTNLSRSFYLNSDAIHRMNESEAMARAETQRLREEYGLSGQKLVEVRNQLNQTTVATQQYSNALIQPSRTMTQLRTSVNPLKMSLVDLDKVMASFTTRVNPARMSLVNLSKDFEEFRVLRLNPTKKSIEEVTASLQKQSEAMRLNGAETLRNMGYKGRLSAEEAQVRANSYSSTTATQQYTNALNKSTTATQRQATATQSLGRAFSSLRMIGTMVASMMVWNFASNLIKATRETVNAKSEMEGYFQMLHFGQGQIDRFNKALTDTVNLFPRINKYSLGETISSIGVEFSLTTKEMEKAMPIVSMITSEYLRAGRNANEASLAVKDILQGEFQRLSRETGVKQDTLKEAGWSGDKTDVMGLLDALDKVGKARHWDVFVTKANSLNDAVMILQNRFGEWSAEMVNVVQPTILGVFNALMSVGGLVGTSLGRVWEWLNGDGLENQAVKWTGIATAIGTVSTALVVYRTGANLTQLAQMGLRGSIIATILELKAEEVATYGSRNAIISKITSINAEKVATLGVKDALLTKVLGLHTELVAQKGIKGAIMASTFARQLEEASIEGVEAEEMKAIVLKQREQLENMGTVSAIFARITGLNMETFAERGLIVALAQRIAQSPLYIGALEAEEVAELSTAEAGLLLAGTLAPLIAIMIGLGVAIYSVVKPLMDASAEMKRFNDIVNNSESIMNESYATQKQYRDEVSKLKGKLSEATEGTKKYKRIQDQLNTATQNYAIAQKNVETNIKAVNLAKNSKDYYESKKEEIARSSTIALADAYIKAGYSATEASEMASTYYRDAEKGAKQLRNAIQMIAFEDKNRKDRTNTMLGYLKKFDVPKGEVKKLVGNLNDAHDKIAEGLDRFMTSDDLMERVGGWFEIQEGRFEAWWTEFNALFEVRDWEGLGDKLLEGIKYVFTGFGSYDWISGLSKELGEHGLVGTIMNALWGEGDSDGALDIISDWGYKMIVKPMADWIAWFAQDPVSHFYETTDSWSLALAEFLYGKDNIDGKAINDMTDEFMHEILIDPVVNWINTNLSAEGIARNIANGIGEMSFDWGQIWANVLFGNDNPARNMSFDDFKTGLWDCLLDSFKQLLQPVINAINSGDIINYIKQELGNWNIYKGIIDAITNSGSSSSDGDSNSGGSSVRKTINVADLLKGVINYDYDGLMQLASDIVNLFKDSLTEQIKNIPVVGSVADLLGLGENTESEAQTTGNQIGTGITTGTQQGLSGVPQIVQTAFGSFDLSGILSKFTTNTTTMTTTATSTASKVGNAFVTMKNNHKTQVDAMVNKNTTAFKDMQTKSNSSMLQMRNSTSQVTSQMTNAWKLMKDNIVASANKIKTDSESRFRGLGTTIGNFYKKIRNPSLWGSGAGLKSYSKSPKPHALRNVSISSRNSGRHGAGYNPYKSPSSSTMNVKELMKLIDSDEDINVADFLSLFSGGFGGWNFSKSHTEYIKNQSNNWKTARASVRSIGSVGNEYTVSKFNGTPKFTWNDFMSTAQSIFSAIPYKFYYDSEWKGNWVNALLSGATNCSDGSDALIALAKVFGFDGYKQHTTLKDGVGHFFAVINGHKLDTTNFQNHGSWSPLGGAGIPPRRHSSGSTHNYGDIHIVINNNGDDMTVNEEMVDRETSRKIYDILSPSLATGV